MLDIPPAAGTAVLNAGTEDRMLVTGFRRSIVGTVLFITLVVVSGGLLLLVTYWKPEWKVALTRRRCSLTSATEVLLQDNYGQKFVAAIQEQPVIDGVVVDEYIMAVPQSRSAVGSGNDRDGSSDQRRLVHKPTRMYGESRCMTGYYLYFDHHHTRYVWNPERAAFCRLIGLEEGTKCLALLDRSVGLSQAEQRTKQMLYGPNEIVIEVKSYFRLFVEEVLNPFYIFQLASVTLWAIDSYYYYASCIVFITCVSIGVSLYETKKQSLALHDMVKTPMATVTVVRGISRAADSEPEEEEVPVSSLVPGDLIVVPAGGCIMQCDAALISGSCVVNESMLTGESVPVTKTPLSHQEDSELYSAEEHKRHTLFCGTHVLQTRRHHGDAAVRAVVVRTGFHTSKGELVRAILFPKPMGFKFYRDAMRFILVLACIAAVGMGYSLWPMITNERPWSKILLRVLDIITIVVPPALPAAMTVGTVYAQGRLKKRGIFCISPPRINLCGKMKVICFDKTGTLTEDGLDLWGLVPVEDRRFQHVVHDGISQVRCKDFLAAMATCHSLTLVNGELTGDPLDLKMFEATGWELEEPGEDTSNFGNLMPTVVRSVPARRPTVRRLSSILSTRSDDDKTDDMAMKDITQNGSPLDTEQEGGGPRREIGIIRQFTFTSSLQRMSVITRALGSEVMILYAKGAPERIVSLCLDETIPEDFHAVLRRYTMQGYRVIALACRTLEHLTWHRALKVPRDQVECDLTFVGLMVMQNMVKPQTTPTIKLLSAARIRTIMITGDNMLTALSVARECHMIHRRERVFLVHASPAHADEPAEVTWEIADMRSPEDDGDATAVEEGAMPSFQPIDTELAPEQTKYHFAIAGKSLAIITQHFPELLDRIIVRGTIFARVSPEQKGQLVEHLKTLGYGVGMCGDGANDCVALKAAHAGISLSEAEASVASPFTSKVPNVECVLTIIREGRAALVTSFGMFKFMALYSFIQFASVILLYTVGTNLGDQQFLYIDLAIVTTVAILMGRTTAYTKLVAERPMGSLMSLVNLFSIFFEMILVSIFQVLTFIYLKQQPWYTPVASAHPDAKETVNCYESTVIFTVSSFQYIIVAICFSTGPPYRLPLWTNVAFLVTIVALTAFSLLLLFHPFSALESFFQMSHIDDKYIMFKVTLLLGIAMNFFISFIVETFIVSSSWLKRVSRFLRRKKQPINKYKLIEQELRANPEWPSTGHKVVVAAATH